MKKSLIAALLFAGFATSAMAQSKTNRMQERDGRPDNRRHRIESPEQQARAATDKLDKQLGLTDKQKSDVYKLNLDRAKKMVVAREKAQKQRLQQIKKMQSERADREKKLNRILNSDQQEKYAKLQRSRADKFKDRRRHFDKKRRDVARRDSDSRTRAAVGSSR